MIESRPLSYDRPRDYSNEDAAATIAYLRERVRVMSARIKELEEERKRNEHATA